MLPLKKYGIGIAHLVPILFLLYSYSPLPHPETVFYNMPSRVLQNKNIFPLPQHPFVHVYIPLYLNGHALLKHFLPILVKRGLDPHYSEKDLFDTHYENYTGYTRQIYELSLTLKLQKGVNNFLNAHPLPTPYSVEGLARVFRQTLDPKLIFGIDKNPLYFKIQFPILLNTLVEALPQTDTRALFLTPEFSTAVVFPTEAVAPPALPYPSLPPNMRATHLSEMAEHIGWRILIAGTKQKKETAKIFDDREPGCLVAMARAFKYALQSLDTPLSVEQVITTHRLCVEGVSGDLNPKQKENITAPFRQAPAPVGFTMFTSTESNMTPAGKREFCLYPQIDRDYTFRHDYLQTLLYGPRLEQRMDEILTHYNQEMRKATNPQQKLYHIVHTLALLERIHPFWDANGRTFCTVLLNRELLRHGFPVTVLDNPNYCDGYSTPEFMQEVVKGFENYQYIKVHGYFPGERPKKTSAANQRLVSELKQIFIEAAKTSLQ